MQRLKHFNLPERHNKLYADEAINSIHLTQGIADKINELVDAFNTVNDTDLQYKQEIEGSYNKLVLWVKENLKNSIYDLFKILEDNGDIKAILDKVVPEIVENELTFAANEDEKVLGVSYVKDPRYFYGDVKRYGAISNGTADNSTVFNNVADICRNAGYPFICDSGDYRIAKEVDLRGVPFIEFNGRIINDETAKVIIGSSSSEQDGIKAAFDRVGHLYCVGLKNSEINVRNVDVLELYANGDSRTDYSIGYCSFSGEYAGEIILRSEGNEIGWINENVFDFKRVNTITIDGNYDHNNNHFLNCNLEHGVLNLTKARNNHFSARGENFDKVVLGEDSQANFIEQQYYYNHYFGNEPKEFGKGNLQYLPIHKLQVEEEVLRIDKNHRSHPVGTLTFSANDRILGKNFATIFSSDITPLDNTIAIKFKANQKVLRARLNFYDANMNRIVDEVNCIADGNMKYYRNEDWSYMISANADDDTLVLIAGGDAKYFKYEILFGSSIGAIPVEYISAKLIKIVNTDTHICNTIPYDVYTTIPDTGYWKQGTILYKNAPTYGDYIGIVCVESGMPGRWEQFGKLAD